MEYFTTGRTTVEVAVTVATEVRVTVCVSCCVLVTVFTTGGRVTVCGGGQVGRCSESGLTPPEGGLGTAVGRVSSGHGVVVGIGVGVSVHGVVSVGLGFTICSGSWPCEGAVG